MCASCIGMPATASNPGAISFFSYTEMPHFDFVEMDYGMKVVMTKPGPEPGTEFVDEMSLALAEHRAGGRYGIRPRKADAAALIKAGSQCEHWMFVTPNDDDHFMLFTAEIIVARRRISSRSSKRARQRNARAGSDAVRQAQVHALQRQRTQGRSGDPGDAGLARASAVNNSAFPIAA